MSNENSAICFLLDKIQKHDSDIEDLKAAKVIFDIQEIRGPQFTTSSTTDVSVGNKITINCPASCKLVINYFVDTRNTGTSSDPRGYFNYYDIYVDGVNQAITNQASFPVPNSAIPLSLNGVVPASAGSHEVEIYAKVNGGTLESHESGLQVTAIQQ